MKFSLKNNVNRFIRLSIIITLVIFVGSSSNVVESKVDNINQNKVIDLSSMARKYEEDVQNEMFASLDTFVGSLTGYVANCPLCSGKLACTGAYMVGVNPIYNDLDYGNVKIVASSNNLPCGSVIKFEEPSLSGDPIIAIVLDRGVTGNGIDLLTDDYDYAISKIGRKTITYDVIRSGWKKKNV